MSILSLILCFSLAFGLSFVSTPLVRKMAFKMGAVDVPDEKGVSTKRVHHLLADLQFFMVLL